MEQRKYKTKAEVLARGQEAIGKTLGEIDKTGRIATGKGAIGTAIEESWFGYKPNNKPVPDFEEAGVELKVTPYKQTSKGVSAKERLVCTMLNYEKECDKTFETSEFWQKCSCMLIMFYQYKKGTKKKKLKIEKVILLEFSEEDLEIIRNDWKIIIDKVRNGQAHLISERDTMYLSACTKGRNARDITIQPYSSNPAKRRAYSLKTGYMTQILRQRAFSCTPGEKIIKNPEELRTSTFENKVEEMFQPYIGISRANLKKRFGITSNAKNINELILSKMLGIKGKPKNADEFKKAYITPKTITIKMNGNVRESVSFPAINFCKIINETWETSTLYDELTSRRFLFVVFEKKDDGECYFKKVKFWSIPNEDLEKVHHVWDRTVEILKNSKNEKGKKLKFPRKSESKVAHIRPHGKNKNDTAKLPNGNCMTKQSFWLNNQYIAEQIEK